MPCRRASRARAVPSAVPAPVPCHWSCYREADLRAVRDVLVAHQATDADGRVVRPEQNERDVVDAVHGVDQAIHDLLGRRVRTW